MYFFRQTPQSVTQNSLRTAEQNWLQGWHFGRSKARWPSGPGVPQQWSSQLLVRILRLRHGWRRPRPHRGAHHPEGRGLPTDRLPAGQLWRHPGSDLGGVLQRPAQADRVRRSCRVQGVAQTAVVCDWASAKAAQGLVASTSANWWHTSLCGIHNPTGELEFWIHNLQKLEDEGFSWTLLGKLHIF